MSEGKVYGLILCWGGVAGWVCRVLRCCVLGWVAVVREDLAVCLSVLCGVVWCGECGNSLLSVIVAVLFAVEM